MCFQSRIFWTYDGRSVLSKLDQHRLIGALTPWLLWKADDEETEALERVEAVPRGPRSERDILTRDSRAARSKSQVVYLLQTANWGKSCHSTGAQGPTHGPKQSQSTSVHPSHSNRQSSGGWVVNVLILAFYKNLLNGHDELLHQIPPSASPGYRVMTLPPVISWNSLPPDCRLKRPLTIWGSQP